MIIRLNTLAGVGKSIDRVGNYLTLVSCSSGAVKLKAFDAESRELFSSSVFSGASIDFDFVATKIQIETEIDAEVVIFWSKSKFYSPVVNVQGAGVARLRTVAVSGLAKLNTITGQNKSIQIKAREGKVSLVGQLGAQRGGWELAQGESVTLETSGDIFARGSTATVNFELGAQTDLSSGAITYFNKFFDKDGNLYGAGAGGLIVGIGHATHPSWLSNAGCLAKFRDRLFIVSRTGGGITVFEIVDGKMLYSAKVKTSLSLGTLSPICAHFSNDGNSVYCIFTNATGGQEDVILDLANGSVSANWKSASHATGAGTDNIAAYNDGWLKVNGNTLYFVDVNGVTTEVEKTGPNLGAGASAKLKVSGGTVAVLDTQNYKMHIAYDNTFDFEAKTLVVSTGSLLVVGDFVAVFHAGGVRAYPRFGAESNHSLGALDGNQQYDVTHYVKSDGAVIVAFTTAPSTATPKLTKMPVGTLAGPTLPELVDVAELF